MMEVISERALMALFALMLHMALAGPQQWYRRIGLHLPAIASVKALRLAERKLNRSQRSPAVLRSRGRVWLIISLVLAMLLGVALHLIFRLHYYGAALEVLVLIGCLNIRPISDKAGALVRALHDADMKTARQVLAGLHIRNAAVLDHHGLARVMVEQLAVTSLTHAVGVILIYLCFGLPGVWAWLVLSAMLRITSPSFTPFAIDVWRVAGWVMWVPSLITSFLWVVASAMVPAARPRAALQQWRGMLAPHPPYGRQLAVAGSALGVSLGGAASPFYTSAWLGGDKARATFHDVKQARQLCWVVTLILALACGVFSLGG